VNSIVDLVCVISPHLMRDTFPCPDFNSVMNPWLMHVFFFFSISLAHVLQLSANGLSPDVTMKIPHYLNNSRLFSRFNESGNRMKSEGHTIWRVRARCRNDIPGVDAPINGTFHLHSPTAFLPQQQRQHEGTIDGLMMLPDPLLWEFLPYERSIVGEPPLAIVGTAWEWDMKVHDPWAPRKKVSWSFFCTASSHSENGSSSPLSTSASSSSPSASPRWLSLKGSRLKGTPTEPGIYPMQIQAKFQGDGDPEPIVVHGNYTIEVAGTFVSESPEGDPVDGAGDPLHGHEFSVGGDFGVGGVVSGDRADDVFPSLIGEHMSQIMGMSAHQRCGRWYLDRSMS
jgi:hypothetical protein